MIDEPVDDAGVQRFWEVYAAAACVGHNDFAVVRFGDGPDLADELAAQVTGGFKRATSRLLRDFTDLGRALPKPGDHGVFVDGKNSPCCIIQTVQVDVRTIRDVDEDFAAYEGGGDGSLAWWRSAHWRYFRRQGIREGFEVDDDTEVVLERFDVVWPLALADRRRASV
jgi:uncharacterized protein YhfF